MIFRESTGNISYFDGPLPGTRGVSWRCRRKPKTSCRPGPVVLNDGNNGGIDKQSMGKSWAFKCAFIVNKVIIYKQY